MTNHILNNSIISRNIKNNAILAEHIRLGTLDNSSISQNMDSHNKINLSKLQEVNTYNILYANESSIISSLSTGQDFIITDIISGFIFTLNMIVSDNKILRSHFIEESLTSINFKTSDYQGFGNLIINIISEEEENIVAKLEKMEKPYYTFRSVVNLDGETVLDKIPEGNYSLTFFQDSDNNMQYSYGTIDPYKSSEWFYNFQDTVKIRSNWDIELQEIKLDLEF